MLTFGRGPPDSNLSSSRLTRASYSSSARLEKGSERGVRIVNSAVTSSPLLGKLPLVLLSHPLSPSSPLLYLHYILQQKPEIHTFLSFYPVKGLPSSLQ